MGYYTYYTLELEGKEQDIAALKESADEQLEWPFNDLIQEDLDRTKWYEYKTDMKKFSKLFPTLTFHLSGEGEESGDIWKATFVDGKCHHREAEVVIAEFDPAELE